MRESTRRKAWSCSVHTWSWSLSLWSRWSASQNLWLQVSEGCWVLIISFIWPKIPEFEFLIDPTDGLSQSPLLSSSGQLSVLGQATPNPKQATRKILSSKKKEAQNVNYKCPECQIQFGSKEEVAEHFQELKPAQIAVSFDCLVCSRMANEQKGPSFLHLLFSSPAKSVLLPCSFPIAAAQRLINASIELPHLTRVPSAAPPSSSRCFKHTWATPVCTIHVASDTGALFSESCEMNNSARCWWIHWSEFHCFLLLIILRCYSCLVVFGGLNSVKSHIQQAHCDVFHKCPSCPMAFKSANSIQSHITSQHPALTDRQTTYGFTLCMRKHVLEYTLTLPGPCLFLSLQDDL